MKAWPLVLCLSALAALAGCGKQDGAGHAASHAKDEHAATHDKAAPAAEAGHGHDHGAGTEKLTHFTERTELFVEFAPLVVGEKSAFAAHVSRLSDFRAVTAGKLSVHLSSEGQPEEVFAVDAPTQPGIFRPEATPKHAGERELSIKIATAEFSVTHALGPVTVHANRKAAEAESAEHEDEGIAFTKEQQWKVDFATAEVVQRPIRAAIDATGTLRARPDGEALLSAPATGQIQSAGAFPRLGQSVDKGQVLAHLVPRMGGDTDVATLRADVAKAKIEHDLAREELARLEGLYRDEAVPEKRVHAARAAAATARARPKT